jgi:hypothetical protein
MPDIISANCRRVIELIAPGKEELGSTFVLTSTFLWKIYIHELAGAQTAACQPGMQL